MGKAIGIALAVIGVAVIAFLALWLTDVDVEDGGELPSVDVEADAGEMPEVDVDVAEVRVGEREVKAEVPDVDVDVDTREVGISLPTVEKVEPADAEGDEAEASPEIDPGEGDDEDDERTEN